MKVIDSVPPPVQLYVVVALGTAPEAALAEKARCNASRPICATAWAAETNEGAAADAAGALINANIPPLPVVVSIAAPATCGALAVVMVTDVAGGDGGGVLFSFPPPQALNPNNSPDTAIKPSLEQFVVVLCILNLPDFFKNS